MEVITKLLLLVLADPVVLLPPAAIAVHTRRRELPLGGVLGDVGDGDANSPRKFHLGSKVSSHGTINLL